MRKKIVNVAIKSMSVFVMTVFCVVSVFAQNNSKDMLMLSLDEALQIALSENLTVKVADVEIEKKGYAKKGVYASLYPQVSFGASYQKTLAQQVMYMDGIPGASEEGLKIGRDNNWNMGFQASMPVVSAPLWMNLKISAQEVELAVEKARSSKLSMVEAVRHSFYGVLMANDSYQVFKATYDNAYSSYLDIKGKYEHGFASEYDLIRADVSVKNAEPNMYNAESAKVLSKWRLKALLGLDLEMLIDCRGSLNDYQKELLVDHTSMNVSIENNTSLKQISIQYHQLQNLKKAQIAEYYPSLNLTWSYNWISMNNDFKMQDYTWDPYSVVGISLSIPIFSGGKRYSKVKETEVALQQLEWQKEDLERNLSVSIRQSIENMNTAVKQHNAAVDGVNQAIKGYEISLKRYDTGQGTLLEVDNSRLAQTQIELSLNQSIYNYLVSKASLEAVLGQDEVLSIIKSEK